MTSRTNNFDESDLDTGLARDLFRKEALNAMNEACFIEGAPKTARTGASIFTLCAGLAALGLFTTALFYNVQKSYPVKIVRSEKAIDEWHISVPAGLSDRDVLDAAIAIPVGKGLASEHPFSDIAVSEIRNSANARERIAVLAAPIMTQSDQTEFDGLLYAGIVRPIDLITGQRK